MPTYTYQCRHCQKTAEVIHGMMEDPEVVCEDCKMPCTKIIAGPPMVGIDAKHRSVDSSNYYGRDAVVPINIIDENPDGSMKVTTIHKKGDGPELANDKR